MPDHDEIIKEVRAIREAYAERFGFDVKALSRDARARQQQSGRRVVAFEPRRVELVSSEPRAGEQKKPR